MVYIMVAYFSPSLRFRMAEDFARTKLITLVYFSSCELDIRIW